MIKVTIKTNKTEEVVYVDSSDAIARVNKLLLDEYCTDCTELQESVDKLETRVKEMGYQGVLEALDELESINEQYGDLERTAGSLGYDDIESCINDVGELQGALRDVQDIVSQYC